MEDTSLQTVDTSGLVEGTFRETWELFVKDAVLYIVASLVVTICSIVSLFILLGPLNVGFIDIVRRRRRGEKAGIGDVFGCFSQFGSSFGLLLLLGIGVLLGLLLLIIPGIVFMFLAAFAFQELAYRKVGPVDAIKGSISLVKSNITPVLLLMFGALVISFVGGMVPFGGLLTNPFVTVLLVVGYEKISGQTP